MKEAVILKTAGAVPVTPEQLEKINSFSRRELTAEEVYVFTLVLCDNEVDRDFERFPPASVEKLAELFVGTTGIFDHNPKGENQNSRIFETAVEVDETIQTTAGDAYCALRAWAYMVRCDKNADLILEIDAGIKKEVSVGCAVERVECSLCGADMRKKPCAHEAGKSYDGVLCWHELVNPTDAYEWSFVAVPAQKMAGVTKGHGQAISDTELQKALEAGDAVTLTKGQARALSEELKRLSSLADCGEKRMEELRKSLVKTAAFAAPALDCTILREVADRMDERQLEAFCKGFSRTAPAFLQLGGTPDTAREDYGAFRI